MKLRTNWVLLAIIGFFTVEIPLGADLNGNGETDKIKFTLAALQAADVGRTFIVLPDGTVINNFDAVFDISASVVDLSQDPPFSTQLSGPVSISSILHAPQVSEVPEATTLGGALAVAGLSLYRYLRAKRA